MKDDIKNIDTLKAIAYTHIQALTDKIDSLGFNNKDTYSSIIMCSAIGIAAIFDSQEKRGFEKTNTAIKKYADVIKAFCEAGK